MANKNSLTDDSESSSNRKWYWIGGILLFFIIAFFSQTENYSEGERIGFLTKFSRKGLNFKSWEGELNLTQTGMNTSSLFDFSIDNDKEKDLKEAIMTIDSAVNNGWKVKLKYHQTNFKNWFSNRGETNYFVYSIEVLDRNSIGANKTNDQSKNRQGKIIDTVYVVIDKSELIKQMKEGKKKEN